ncbi:hypothetical protein [Leptothoe kymatousa]|uniref:Uncharacterized protein n=1 Tax=Leptothoe kymatousa TAU-MAC 1615 TaxID=2364775 RepID=A0ABS5Y214_9CYAN|nr:hypothetical protein [Leptothoe kymatousa]MBT9311869.1 hypothetical protein [Leptothoe kymatousa TAU-MAC 1615]
MEQDRELIILISRVKDDDLTRWGNYGVNTDGSSVRQSLMDHAVLGKTI